jgi:hypothetical protein
MAATGAMAGGAVINKLGGAGEAGVHVPADGIVDIAAESVAIAPPQRSHWLPRGTTPGSGMAGGGGTL